MKLIFYTNELKSLAVARYFQLGGQPFTIYDVKKRFSFDDSFLVEGYLFDCGYHAVDISRSKRFNQILDSLDMEWIITPGAREMGLMSMLLPRGYDFEDLPSNISRENKGLYDDQLLSELEDKYGSDFTKYCLEEIALSYVQNTLWSEMNLGAEQVLKNIYPWFFPKLESDKYESIQPHYHYTNIDEHPVRYPAKNGFMSITHKLRRALEGGIKTSLNENGELYAAFDDYGIFKSSGAAEHGIHLAPIDYVELSERFSLPYPKHQKTNFYLVSIVFETPQIIHFNEVLMGDRQYLFDRVGSPDFLEGKICERVQFEAESLEPLEDDDLLANIKMFVDQHIGSTEFKHVDIKKVKINRYLDPDIVIKTKEIIDFVETKNQKLIVLNRSMNYENLSDSIPGIINLVESKLNEND